MEKNEKSNLYLIGFMGAGKSTIARMLSKKMGKALVEMDERIVKEQGMSINEIFEIHGEEYFRQVESRLVQTLGREGNCIVSCGGGVAVRQENVDHMRESGRIVFLSATPETIYQRVKNSTDRPILNGHMNVEYIEELMEKRRGFYEAAADIVISTDDRSREDICAEIMKFFTN